MKTWEDHIRPAHCRDVVTEQAAALADQQRQIVGVREELARTKWERPVRVPQKPIKWTPERIRRLRIDCGYSVTNFAREVGTTRPNYTSWESGTRRPGPYNCDRLNELERELEGRQAA